MNKKWLAFIISGLTINLIFSTAFAVYFFIATKNVEFDKNKLVNDNLHIEYIADNGEKISPTFQNVGDNYVKINDLSNETKNAFVAIEDKRFYKHNGLDYLRMLKASFINLKTLSFKEGGSTITQQLVKNTHLTGEKTINRKLKEIKLSKQMEKVMTKSEILESYLNTVYFGKGAYGLASASKIYFNKTADKLTLNEAAALAATIKSPNNYSPINSDKCFERKNLVLNAMLNQNYITTEKYECAIKEAITTKSDENKNFLSDYLSATTNEFEKLGVVPTYLKQNKVKIYTYLDEAVQKFVYELTIDDEQQKGKNQIVINNKNTGVIAFYGKNSNLSRCPASTIKPIYIYAPFIDNGKITESTVLIDEETDFSGYAPKNYGGVYNGKVTIKTAISKSLNVPAVRLLNYFGSKDGVETLKKVGVRVDGNNLSSALGGGISLSLKNLCDLYSPFVFDGEYKESSFIKKIEVNGKLVYERNPKSIRLFKDSTAFIINDALKDCAKNGTAKKLRDLDFDVCAKTGTNGNSEGNIDAYCVAYTTEHTVGCWYGNEDATLMPSKIQGGTYPTIRVKSVLKNLYKTAPPKKFKQPKSIIAAKIDETTLLNDEITYLSNDKYGKVYYYELGTEPMCYKTIDNNPTIKNYNLNVYKNGVDIELELSCAEKVVIYKILNGKKTKEYSGNGEVIKLIGSFNDCKLEIVPIGHDGKFGESLITPTIKQTPNNWWNE